MALVGLAIAYGITWLRQPSVAHVAVGCVTKLETLQAQEKIRIRSAGEYAVMGEHWIQLPKFEQRRILSDLACASLSRGGEGEAILLDESSGKLLGQSKGNLIQLAD